MLGGNIREMLARSGKSQRDLADAIGVTQTMVSRWVRGENTPDAKQLLAIAEAIGVPAGDLLEKDLAAWTNRDLARRNAVDEIIALIGYEEAHRRLLMVPPPPRDQPQERAGEDPATSDATKPTRSVGSPRGSHTVAKVTTLDDLREEVDGRARRKPDGDKASSDPNRRP